MDRHRLPAESPMLATTTSLLSQTIVPIPYSLTPATSTTSFIFTVATISTGVVSSPSLQPLSVVSVEPNHTSPPTIAAIVGGSAAGVTLLALLITFIVVRSRRRQQIFSVTPFNLLSTTAPPRIEPRVWLELRSTDSLAISSPSGGGSYIIQLKYSDSYLAQDSRDGSLSAPPRNDAISFQLPNNNDTSASTVARRQRSHELEKLYPSHVHSSDRYRDCGGDDRAERVVASDNARESSEELPAYPRSLESLKSGLSRDVDHDHSVLPSSHTSLS